MSGSFVLPSVIVDRAIASSGKAAIRSMTSCKAASNASACWCWMMVLKQKQSILIE
jgi:hypothetical protein